MTEALPDPFEVLTFVCHTLALRPREKSVLQYCLMARSQVSNGHFLASSGMVASAERLIAKGYLTKAEHQTTPQLGMVVVLEKSNSEKLINDANAAIAKARKVLDVCPTCAK